MMSWARAIACTWGVVSLHEYAQYFMFIAPVHGKSAVEEVLLHHERVNLHKYFLNALCL